MRSAISGRGRNTPARTWRLAGASAVGILVLVIACSDEIMQPSSMAVAIDSVSPRASEAGETVELRIVGTGFETGSTASVEHGGAPSATVVAEKTNFMNESELHFTMSIGADATPALYDIIVSNPDGTRAAASGIFSVQAATPIIVSEAVPSEAAQGETRTILIRGSGFLEGDEVAWERGGVIEEDVVVGQVEFVSSEEMSVTIEVRDEAPVADYDVTVARPRKKGIGTEAFAVLPGIGSVLDAQFSFTYDGYRNDSFEVDDTFILDPETMDPGSWGLTYYTYEQSRQVLGANHLRADGLVDMMWCDVPGVRVREPGTYPLDCWFTPQYNFETGEFADPEDYTSYHGGDRPGDGTGTVTFTSVTRERLVGTFSIEMHVVDWEDWLSSPSITISDGTIDLPIVSSYWQSAEADGQDTSFTGTSKAIALNDHGVVIGTASNERGEQRAVRWTVSPDGNVDGPRELGAVAGYADQYAADINNEGVIVGDAGVAPFNIVGFLYDGAIRLLSPLEDALTAGPRGINDQGVVVGQSHFESTNSLGVVSQSLRGAVWLNPSDPNERPVQLPSGDTWALGRTINNHGVIVGDINGTGSVRWQLNADGKVTGPEPIGLANVVGINDTPDFAGNMIGPPTGQPTLLRNDTYIALDPLPGHPRAEAAGLNNPLTGQSVQVVGSSYPDPSWSQGARPVVWSVNGSGGVTGPTDLGIPSEYDMGWPLDVNVHGWIVGSVLNFDVANPNDFDEVATLWRPRDDGTGYDIITLGTLAQPAGSGSIVFSAPNPCRPRPGRPDRSMSCR